MSDNTLAVARGKKEAASFLEAAKALGFEIGPVDEAGYRYPVLNQGEVLCDDEKKVMKALANKACFKAKRNLFPDEIDHIYFFQGTVATAEYHAIDEVIEFDYTSNY